MREADCLLATGGTEAQFEQNEERMGHEVEQVQASFLRNIKKDRVELGDRLTQQKKHDSPVN